MKIEKTIIALLSLNTVFGNSLPPCIENSLPPCIDKQVNTYNSLTPTPECVASLREKIKVSKQDIQLIQARRMKMFELRTYC